MMFLIGHIFFTFGVGSAGKGILCVWKDFSLQVLRINKVLFFVVETYNLFLELELVGIQRYNLCCERFSSHVVRIEDLSSVCFRNEHCSLAQH